MSSREACVPQWGSRMNGERDLLADEDGVTVRRFLSGETDVFDTLFLKYQDYVFHIVYGVVGKTEEARDLTQEVFLQAYRSLPGFRHNSRFSTWLYRIAVNRAVDAARGARRWRWIAIQDTPQLATYADRPDREPEHVIGLQADRDAIQRVLMRCPLNHREVLALRYYRDLTLEEIAETLSISVAAAKVRLHRARSVFKEHYVATFGTESPYGYKLEEADVTQSVR